MKTKEEILAKWRQPLKEETGHDIEKICLLEAMEEYAQAYHEDKTRWISVDDELPVYYNLFLGITNNSLFIGWRANDGESDLYTIAGTDTIIKTPTHWQPLPTPPKINAE